MQTEAHSCIIGSSVARSLAAILFLPGLFLALHAEWVAVGHSSPWDFSHFLTPNDVPPWKTIIGAACAVVGTFRYIPHSIRTLLGGSCILSSDGANVLLYGRTRFPVSQIENVEPVSGLFRKGIVITTTDGHTHYVCTIMSDDPNPAENSKVLRTLIDRT